MLSHDIRFAARTLRRSPAFTATAILCLGIGIGAGTGIFSIVNAVLLKPLPFRDPNRLVRVYTEFPNFPGGGLHRFGASSPEFREIQQQARPWDQVEAWTNGGASLEGANEAVRITACYVSGGMLSMLGAVPSRGRLIAPSDDLEGAPLTIVLSDGLWKRAFGADPRIVGRETLLDGRKATVIGILPSGFDFPPGANEPAEAWVPLQLTAQQMTRRGNHFLSLIAHLRPGFGIEEARRDLASIVNHFGGRASPRFHTIHPKNHPLVMYGFQEEVIGNVRKAMLMLLGAVAFFLLIACVNVANLLLARSDARQREIAVRKAIGAAGPHLVRQFAAEGLLLSSAGAALGLLIGWAGVRLAAVTNAGTIPRLREAGIDIHVLLFALGVCVLTGLVFGLAPLMPMVTRPLQEALKAASGRSSGSIRANRFRAALVAAELSLALILLIGSGLLVRAFWNLQQVHPGMNAEGVLTVRISLTSKPSEDPARRRAFWQSLNERLARLPGVVSASVCAGLPPQRFAVQNDTAVENFVPRPGGPIQNVAFYQTVADRFFQTLEIRLLDGRFFDSRDGFGGAPSVIVNQTMARAFWPGESAVGKRIRPSGAPDWLTIVGVVEDVKNAGLDQPVGAELFLPALQSGNATQGPFAIVKAGGDPMRLANAVREAVRRIDPAVPVSTVRTMEAVMAESQSRPRFLALVLTLFSSLALALAAFGVYGVISYSVSQRTAEFGIRMALGAQHSDVMRLVLVEGAILGGAGLLAGGIGAALLTRGLDGLLFQVSRFDVPTFAFMAAVLGAVTLLACWAPARRATSIDPIRALRYE